MSQTMTLPRARPMRPRAAAPPPAASVITLPPDRDVQPITEAAFRAVVRGFDASETEEGTVYSKDDATWRYLRRGAEVTVRHDGGQVPDRHYLII